MYVNYKILQQLFYQLEKATGTRVIVYEYFYFLRRRKGEKFAKKNDILSIKYTNKLNKKVTQESFQEQNNNNKNYIEDNFF